MVELNRMALGDMVAWYWLDEKTRQVELRLLPYGTEPRAWDSKTHASDSLLQLKLLGDAYPGYYAGGKTLRQSASVAAMHFVNQEQLKKTQDHVEIITHFADDRGYRASHHLLWRSGPTLESHVEFSNHSGTPVSLEMLSSFSIANLAPCGPGQLWIHRLRGGWSAEGRLESYQAEDMQLEPSWGWQAVRCERFGQVGSMPTDHFFPWLVVEDRESNIFWGAQVAHNASWQMELYRRDDALAVSGGLADRDFGHWVKQVEANEIFTTPTAFLTVCSGGSLDDAAQRLVSSGRAMLEDAPPAERDMAIVFNEYCTTWGSPSHKSIAAMLPVLKDKGITYFVIDCGWFKEDGVPWDINMGDYIVSDDLFPEGLSHTTRAIREAGFIPGIWFEIDNVGPASKAYQMEEHLLHRDGVTLTLPTRRFWDMRDPWVRDYLHEKVTGVLRGHGFGYIKMDYNDTIGPGCDGAESLGEGLRQNMEASFEFIESMKAAVPGLVVENCASGGHKLEPKMMHATAMSSFSDAHECEEIPIIAANLHRAMLPRQSQIWAVLRKADTRNRIVYSVAATFLGRMCLSGDVIELDGAQWQAVEEGIAFYKQVSHIIRDGHSYFYGPKIVSYRHPAGWQGILRVLPNKEALLVIHVFGGPIPNSITIPLGNIAGHLLAGSYTCGEDFSIMDDALIFVPRQPMSAAAFFLRQA